MYIPVTIREEFSVGAKSLLSMIKLVIMEIKKEGFYDNIFIARYINFIFLHSLLFLNTGAFKAFIWFQFMQVSGRLKKGLNTKIIEKFIDPLVKYKYPAAIVILQSLLNAPGVYRFAKDQFQLLFSIFSKTDTETGVGSFFLPEISSKEPVSSKILPKGERKILLATAILDENLIVLVLLGLLALLVCGNLAYLAYAFKAQPSKLKRLVNQKIREFSKSEQKFRTIFNQAAIGIVTVNSRTGEILETNNRFRELLGYSKQDLKNNNFKNISHSDELEENLHLLEKLRNGDIREYSLIKRFITKKGENVWVKLSVAPLWKIGEAPSSHIALVEDISERIKARQELETNEKRFRALVENSNEMILVLDTSGELKYYSPTFKRKGDYSETELESIHFIDQVHKKDQGMLLRIIRKAIQNPEKTFSQVIFRTKFKDGKWLWMNATITNLLNKKHVNGIVFNIRDITEMKENEIALNRSYNLVTDQNKRLLNFSHIISHNLRSHSSNMESLLDLYEDADLPEEKADYIKMLKKVSSSLSKTLTELNDVVSIEKEQGLKVEDLYVKDYVNQALNVLSADIEKKEARICCEIPAKMKILFNPAYLESVLLNLISNSLRYSHPKRKPLIKIKGSLFEDNWQLEIEDNGIGIDLERFGDKLFGLYKTFSDRPESRGVGLFITKNQIEAMGGSIAIESKLDQGTRIKIRFK